MTPKVRKSFYPTAGVKKPPFSGRFVAAQPRDLFGALMIMLLAMDTLAFIVLHMVQLRTFIFGDIAVSFCLVFHFVDAGLVPFQARGFMRVQCARLHTLVDAFLLDFLAFIDTRSSGRILGLCIRQCRHSSNDNSNKHWDNA